jgi:predicted GIY-YIG superfamily endonuclease
VYIGSSQSIETRLKQHQAGIRQKNPKKLLYKTAKENEWTINIIPIKSFNRRSDAKIFETYLITKEIIENGKNTHILNTNIDGGRIFWKNSPFI